MWSKIFGRKFTKNTCHRSIQQKQESLKLEDFDDVFGGPPRCLYFHPSDYFYENVFQNPVRQCAEGSAQGFPGFRISLPGGLNRNIFFRDFLKDIDEVPKSKFQLEELSDDAFHSRYVTELHTRPTFDHHVGKQFTDNEQQTEKYKSTPLGFSTRASSPESSSPGAYSSVKVSVGNEDDFTNKFHKDDDDDDDDNGNEIHSSCFFGINSFYRYGTDEGVTVDEAIAWAKESYQSHSSSAETTEKPDGRVDESNKPLHLQEEEMELLEKDIKLWSSGKERNMELLLSTLQDILWPNSGWCPIPRMKLYENSNVKKAYQRAQLCLHPDKLQQRGATHLQKYVAERIFLILQEAWNAYISQDIIISFSE